MEDINLKILQERKWHRILCRKISEAANSGNRKDIITWYQDYRKKESELATLLDIRKNEKRCELLEKQELSIDKRIGKLTLIDSENLLSNLIKEYSIDRVEAMDKLYPKEKLKTIDRHLDNWKEECKRLEETNVGLDWGLKYEPILGGYFDYYEPPYLN